jgi:hypothetical protein
MLQNQGQKQQLFIEKALNVGNGQCNVSGWFEWQDIHMTIWVLDEKI